MQLIDDEKSVAKAGLPYRLLLPETTGPYPTVVMLHGHLGNEDVMWVFAQTLPPGWLVVAPRAIAPVGDNSYTWQPRAENEWPSLSQLDEAVTAVTRFMQALPNLHHADQDQLYLMGFSQGAAVAFAAALHQPGWVKGIASLVGFVPLQVERAVAQTALRAMPVFMAAGAQDERVPLPIARESATAVRAMGAYLEYREYETGHKLNADAMRKLKAWWQERERFRQIHTDA